MTTGNEILDDCKWFADKHRGQHKQSGPHWSTIIRFPKLYDEAVRLQQRVDTLESYISDFTPDSMTIARLTARVKELEDANRWIPVSERLPEKSGFYLILWRSVGIEKLWIDATVYSSIDKTWDVRRLVDVAYWRENLLLPQEGE